MLSKDDLRILAEELKDRKYANLMKKQDYPAIASMLNETTMVKNPDKQENVPVKFSIGDIFGVLSAEDLVAVRNIPDWVALITRIESALEANDRASLARWLALVQGDLSANGVKSLNTLLNTTGPDPNWQEFIPGPSRGTELGLQKVTEHDVQAVEQGLL